MKWLVFSDSHGAAGAMTDVFDKIRCDGVLFLGDGCRDADMLYEHSGSVPVYRVRGNCDIFCCDAPDSQLLELEGVRVYITHGHLQHVKSGTGFLENIARQQGADLALYGHTHTRAYVNAGGLVLANPGSAAAGSYAVLDTSNGINIKFGDIYE